jgi:hypothetical protein
MHDIFLNLVKLKNIWPTQMIYYFAMEGVGAV